MWEYCLVQFDSEKRDTCSIVFPEDEIPSAVGADFAKEETKYSITRKTGWRWNEFGVKRPETEALSKLSAESGAGLLIKSFSVLGKYGWELVDQEGGTRFYFKRKLK